MPSIKEIYNSIGEVELNADSINLNVDGLEALASTQQADIALIKADVDDIRADLANGVTINQPVAITDNGGSVTVDGSVSVSNFPATQPVSGTVTVAQATAANLNATVVQSTATNLRTQAESYQGGTAVGSGNPLQVTLANTGANTTALRVEPKNGAVTRTTGDTATANTSKQALASNSSRRYLLIQNISDTDMYFNFGATATTDNMLITKNGGGIVFESGYVPTDAVNVICSGADKKYFILSA